MLFYVYVSRGLYSLEAVSYGYCRNQAEYSIVIEAGTGAIVLSLDISESVVYMQTYRRSQVGGYLKREPECVFHSYLSADTQHETVVKEVDYVYSIFCEVMYLIVYISYGGSRTGI